MTDKNVVDVKLKVGARFKAVVRKAATNEIVRESGWSSNLVLNSGLDRMSVGTWIDRCCVGTGNTPPVETQTALQTFRASTTSFGASFQHSYNTTGQPYHRTIATWRFGVGAASGNISEVGLGWGNSSLWNRALIKDGNGNPTSITVLADEYLDVISEVRIYFQTTLSGSFELRDKNNNLVNTINYTGKPILGYISNGVDWQSVPVFLTNVANGSMQSQAFAYTGAMAAGYTAFPTGSISSVAVNSLGYPTARSIRGRLFFDLNVGNGVAIKTLMFGLGLRLTTYQSYGYQIELTPTVSKTSSDTLSFNFVVSWDRFVA